MATTLIRITIGIIFLLTTIYFVAISIQDPITDIKMILKRFLYILVFWMVIGFCISNQVAAIMFYIFCK